jgi:hypothetical protein
MLTKEQVIKLAKAEKQRKKIKEIEEKYLQPRLSDLNVIKEIYFP